MWTLTAVSMRSKSTDRRAIPRAFCDPRAFARMRRADLPLPLWMNSNLETERGRLPPTATVRPYTPGSFESISFAGTMKRHADYCPAPSRLEPTAGEWRIFTVNFKMASPPSWPVLPRYARYSRGRHMRHTNISHAAIKSVHAGAGRKKSGEDGRSVPSSRVTRSSRTAPMAPAVFFR